MYADDILLLSGSVAHLLKMLKICQINGDLLDIKFNPSKSALIAFGKDFEEKFANLQFGNGHICWVNDGKYQSCCPRGLALASRILENTS